LTTLLQSASQKERSTIFLSQKAYLFSATSGEPPAHPALLIRATDGKKKSDGGIKISTLVESDALPPFFEKYAEVAKGGMTTLKKRDRKARKAKARAKGKKGEGQAT
jgi:signal recognition particle subunit SRP14